MKKSIFLIPLLTLGLIFTGCSDDDDTIPEPVEEQEVITTVVITLTSSNNDVYTMRWEDPDYATGNIVAGYSGDDSIPVGTYSGDIQLYNNTLPVDDPEYTITNEILEEGEGGDIDHQFFYGSIEGLSINDVNYLDTDVDGNPIGQQFNLNAAGGSGKLTVLLIHEPEKDAEGMSDGIWNGIGEEDVDLQFPLSVTQ